jgi:hypothetical protein
MKILIKGIEIEAEPQQEQKGQRLKFSELVNYTGHVQHVSKTPKYVHDGLKFVE